MITEFIDGLQQFHFLQNALITAIAIGIVAGAVGCFIILRGMSLMGDAISHAVLPHPLWEYLGRARPGYVDDHRCWGGGLAGNCPALSSLAAHFF